MSNPTQQFLDQASFADLVSQVQAAIVATSESFQATTSLKPSALELVDACRQALTNLVADSDLTHQEAKDLEFLSNPQQESSRPVRGYIDGCFDIMHSGHYNAIRQAKALVGKNGTLVVGVHSDQEIMRHKGPPVMNDEERLAMARACKWADEIVFDTPYDPSLKLLEDLNCDFSIHGDDTSTTSDGKDAYSEVRDAGKLRIIKRTAGVSTTDLVGRLLLMTKSHHVGANDTGSNRVTPVLSPQSPAILASNVSLASVPDLALDASSSSPTTADASNTSPSAPSSSSRQTSGNLESRKRSNSTDKHYSAGVSNFLPTTWRIAQFTNHRVPKADDKVVYIDGAFDLFHLGHVSTLEKAKAEGTFLYVGLHDDNTVNKHKGKNYPIMNQHERTMNVLSCKYVDEVVIGAPWTLTRDLITTLNISVVVSGSNTKLGDDDDDQKEDPYKVPKELGIFKEVETSTNLTTDDVVQRIIDNRLKYQNRNKSRSKKDLNYIQNKSYVQEV